MSFTFFAAGIPRPQGSKRNLGRGRMAESSRHLKAWRNFITLQAKMEMRGQEILTGPVAVSLWFRMPRPKSHYRHCDGQLVLRPGVANHHSCKPDVDKLARAVLDALTGVVYRDDSQVSRMTVLKLYGVRAGVEIGVDRCEPDGE